MIHNRKFQKLTTVMFVLAVFISFQAFSQENKNLRVYGSPEQMIAAAKEVITEIPVDEFKNIHARGDIFIVDVRAAEENKAGAVPGAVNIPRGVLEFRIGQTETWKSAGKNPPEKNDPIIVYCSTGGRGALSAKSLMQLGYENVKSVRGGWGAWHEAYPDIKE